MLFVVVPVFEALRSKAFFDSAMIGFNHQLII
jgi:hypothetical protein